MRTFFAYEGTFWLFIRSGRIRGNQIEALVAELVDALASGASDSDIMGVRVSPKAQRKNNFSRGKILHAVNNVK